MGKLTKQWKAGGAEDKLLKKLNAKGKINKYTRPSTLQSQNPAVFGSFNEQVMRNHLNAFKRANGVWLDTDEMNSDDEEEEPNNEVAKAEAPRGSSDFAFATSVDKNVHVNYPVITQRFVCPETENEKVLMVVTLPGGASEPKVELQDDGFWVYVKYHWPKTMYDVRDLFKSQFDALEFEDYHPMVLSFKTGLSQVRKRIDLCPDGLIKVFLPIKVQAAENSYKIWGVKRVDGAQVTIGVFTGFAKEYVKKVSDEKVKFV